MEYQSDTGAKVMIRPAPFGDVMELKACIFDELKTADLPFDLTNIKNVSTETDFDISKLLKVIMGIAGSRKVTAALEPCLVRCTYNGQKITPLIFDDEKAREDYYEIVFNCLKVNLMPFMKGLGSKLSTLLPTKKIETAPTSA